MISLYLKQKSVKHKNVSSTYGYLTGINPVVLVSFLSVLSGITVRQLFFSLKLKHLFTHAVFQPKPCEIRMFVASRSRRDYRLSTIRTS